MVQGRPSSHATFIPGVPESTSLWEWVSCPALSPELLESELFGHVKGAFTGALKDTVGRIAASEGGSLLLDEIGDLPLTVQPKLLRFLQDREYERVGDTPGHGKLTCASSLRRIRIWKRPVSEKRFREDLFYRLNVIQIEIPPLRERVEDIVPLAESLLLFFAIKNHRQFSGFTDEAAGLLSKARVAGQCAGTTEYDRASSHPLPGGRYRRGIPPGRNGCRSASPVPGRLGVFGPDRGGAHQEGPRPNKVPPGGCSSSRHRSGDALAPKEAISDLTLSSDSHFFPSKAACKMHGIKGQGHAKCKGGKGSSLLGLCDISEFHPLHVGLHFASFFTGGSKCWEFAKKMSLGFGGLFLILCLLGIQSILLLTELGESIDVILRETLSERDRVPGHERGSGAHGQRGAVHVAGP